MGRDRALGNLRWGDKTLSQRNRGLLDDIQDEVNVERQDEESRPQASCVYVTNKNGKVLAVERQEEPGAYGFPGGNVELGEDPEDAATRELWEETGLILKDIRLLFSDINDDGYLVRVYAGNVSGNLRSSSEGQVRWVNPEKLLEGPFKSYTEKFFKSIYRILSFCVQIYRNKLIFSYDIAPCFGSFGNNWNYPDILVGFCKAPSCMHLRFGT